MKKALLMLFSFLTITQLMAQPCQITGRVTDARDGSVFPGVTVMVKGTTTGTSTGNDGSFTLNAPDGATLVFQFIGSENKEIAVAGKNVVHAQFNVDVRTLTEIEVSTGYVSKRKGSN